MNRRFYYSKSQSFVIILFVLISGSLALPSYIYAQEELSISREKWFADENISKASDDFSIGKKIMIIPLSLKTDSKEARSQIKELFYYFTSRSGLGDLPFHFLVTEDGEIFQGVKNGEEQKISFAQTEDTIFIGYLAQDGNLLSLSSLNSLQSLLVHLCNTYHIKPDTIQIQKTDCTISQKGKIENCSLKSSQEWTESITPLIKEVSSVYSPQKFIFNVQVTEVGVPEGEQEAGKTADIKLKIKNTGTTNIFVSSDSNIYLIRNNPYDAKSIFRTSEWDTPSRVAILKSGDRLLKNEEKEFIIKFFVPLQSLTITEDFILGDSSGTIIEGTPMKISLKIKKPSSSVIEITDTPVGYLNVREKPSPSDIITKVVPGERFITKDYQNGYYQIDANGKTGWVVKTYVKIINF